MSRCLTAVTMMLMQSLLGTSVGFGQSPIDTREVEFRIDTDVYLDESKPPVTSTKTMFLQDRCMEWDDTNQRLMIIDFGTQRIELADFKSKRTCTVDMAEIESKLDALKAQMTSEQLQMWSSPNPPDADAEGNGSIQSTRIKYQFKSTSPRVPAMSGAYSDFANWSVRLSAIYPPFKPPLLRLQLNEYLAEAQRLPVEIRLWDLRSKSAEPVVARMLVQEGLTRQDKARIQDWSLLSGTLKSVPPAEFFQPPSMANTKPTQAK
jgi:hypothetical protein